MKKVLFSTCILLSLLLLGCSKGNQKSPMEIALPMINNCSKLYTAQYNVHKIITYEDMTAIEGSLVFEKISIPMP